MLFLLVPKMRLMNWGVASLKRVPLDVADTKQQRA